MALELDFIDFFNETKCAICTQNGQPNFRYSIENDEFIYRKTDEDDNKIKYGVVKLKSTSHLKDQLVCSSLDIISQLRDAIELEATLSTDIRQKHDLFVKQYEKVVNEKNVNETTLISKFLELLNAKKDKISELQSLLSSKNNRFSNNNEKNTPLQKNNDILSDSDMSVDETVENEPSSSRQAIKNTKTDYLAQSSQSQELCTNTSVPKRAKLMENKLKPIETSQLRKTSDVDLFKGINICVSKNSEKDKYDVDTQEMFDEI